MKILTIILNVFFLFEAHMFSSEIAKSSLDFLRLPSSPRTISLGGVNIGDKNNINTFSNPQSLNYQEKRMISLSSLYLYDDIVSRWFIFSFPLDLSSFALGVNHLDYGKIQTIDYSNIDSNIINPRDLLILFGYGYRFKKFEFATNIKYIDSKLSKKAKTVLFDGSISLRISEKLSTCFNVSNLGKKIRYDLQKESLPTFLSFGFWYRLTYFSFGYQYFNHFYSRKTHSFGVEKEIKISHNNLINLRVGYNSMLENISTSKSFSLGFGLESDSYFINYSFIPSNLIGNSNSFSISIKF